MNRAQSSVQLNELLQKDAVEVYNWFLHRKSDYSDLPKDFNWLGLAESAASKAHSKSDLLWAEIAIGAYQKLIDQGSGKESLVISLMLLKASMITKFGSVSGHPVLDMESIVKWFTSSVNNSFDEMAKKAANWKNSPIKEISDLRALKNKLKVISILANNLKSALPKELEVWLSLQEQLP